MSLIARWNIRTQFVGDDGWTHEARVEGPPTPGDKFVEVVRADAYQGAVDLLREVDDGWDRAMETDDLDCIIEVVAKVRAFLAARGGR